jgi:hypothetical protein
MRVLSFRKIPMQRIGGNKETYSFVFRRNPPLKSISHSLSLIHPSGIIYFVYVLCKLL